MATFKLYPAALANLEGIWLYSARNWGIEQAMSYVDALDSTFQLLAENPPLCRQR
jgi:toxin ParE1/3/4